MKRCTQDIDIKNKFDSDNLINCMKYHWRKFSLVNISLGGGGRSGGTNQRPQTPPPSQFKHLGPSENRYTLLEHDEFWAVCDQCDQAGWPSNRLQLLCMWPGNTQQNLVTYVMKSAWRIDHRQRVAAIGGVMLRLGFACSSCSFLAVDSFDDAIFRPRPFSWGFCLQKLSLSWAHPMSCRLDYVGCTES